MKKNLRGRKKERPPRERQSEMSSKEGGRINRILAVSIYIVVIIVIAAIIYYLTRQNGSTFLIGI